jgi:hypothetical protein
MQNTFHVSFTSQVNVKRNYCFSVPTSEAKSKWAQMLRKQISTCRARAQSPSINELRQVAEQVSLQVLRDAVIPRDDNPKQARTAGSPPRRGSISTTYDQLAGKDEVALGPLQPLKGGSSSDNVGLVGIQTGKELVLLCRQNSLMPGLLELLSSARDDVVTNSNSEHHRQREPIKVPRQNGNPASHRGLGLHHGSISESKRSIMTGRF